MPAQTKSASPESRDALLATYAINDAMNQLLLAHLDPRAWRAQLPSTKRGGRTIAAIFAHLHNSRLVWLRHSAPHLKCPAPLDPDRCTMKQAAAAHKRSGAQCCRMLTDALSTGPRRRVTKFSRGAWAPVWPAGGTMFAYMFSHEAHHRGQIIMLAHQLGYRLPDHAAYGIWFWHKLWKQRGLTSRPRQANDGNPRRPSDHTSFNFLEFASSCLSRGSLVTIWRQLKVSGSRAHEGNKRNCPLLPSPPDGKSAWSRTSPTSLAAKEVLLIFQSTH